MLSKSECGLLAGLALITILMASEFVSPIVLVAILVFIAFVLHRTRGA